jgi:hypothetical protein
MSQAVVRYAQIVRSVIDALLSSLRTICGSLLADVVDSPSPVAAAIQH